MMDREITVLMLVVLWLDVVGVMTRGCWCDRTSWSLMISGVISIDETVTFWCDGGRDATIVHHRIAVVLDGSTWVQLLVHRLQVWFTWRSWWCRSAAEGFLLSEEDIEGG